MLAVLGVPIVVLVSRNAEHVALTLVALGGVTFLINAKHFTLMLAVVGVSNFVVVSRYTEHVALILVAPGSVIFFPSYETRSITR